MQINMTNDKTRREFPHNYKSWGVWFYEPLLGVTYYKCKLTDGHQIIVEESPGTTSVYGINTYTTYHNRYHLIKPGKEYCVDGYTLGEIMGELLHDIHGEIDVKTFGEV